MLTEINVLVSCFLLLSIAWPLWSAWRAVRHTSLRHTLYWLTAAWLGWIVATASPFWSESNLPYRYIALCLTACTIVAVLGARFPGMAAWNFVVVALLAILLLSVVEQPWNAPSWRVDGPRSMVLATILAIGLLNYLPTVTMFIAPGLAFLGWELAMLAWPDLRRSRLAIGIVALYSLAFALWSWFTWWLWRRASLANIDLLWGAFAARYGFIWARRVQEQFNAAVANAGGKERLYWRGLQHEGALTEERHAELLAILRATLTRFGMGDGARESNQRPPLG